MDKKEKNKAFCLNYYRTLTGKKKTDSLIRQFVSDEKLIEHIKFFDKTFPEYVAVPEEIIPADDRVFVRLRIEGRHEGEMDGIPPTFKEIKIPFAICYRIENDKIIDHWMIADQMELLEQLGLAHTIKPSFESS